MDMAIDIAFLKIRLVGNGFNYPNMQLTSPLYSPESYSHFQLQFK